MKVKISPCIDMLQLTALVNDGCTQCVYTHLLSLCLSFLSYWNPFYRRVLPRVSAGLAGVNPSLGGSLLRQQPIWQSIASHSPSSLQSANHRAGDDGQPWRSPSLSPSLLSAPVRTTNDHFLSDYWMSVCSFLVSMLRFVSSSRFFIFNRFSSTSAVLERMLCLCGCCVWGWACVCCKYYTRL